MLGDVLAFPRAGGGYGAWPRDALRGEMLRASGPPSSGGVADRKLGVSRAFYDECGGKVLQDEMKAKLEEEFDGVLDEGDCVVTSAGTSTRFRYVLHVPAVDYRGTRARLGEAGVDRTVTSPERIQACTEAALRAAADIAKTEGKPISVSFPLLGAGAGGLPPAVVCHSMIAGLRDFFTESPDAAIDVVVFAVPEPDRLAVCARLIRSAFG